MREYSASIAIVGGGASGMAAAASAAENGADVLVIESNAAVGGNGLFPRGIFGVDSRLQRRKLVFADADEVFRDCMAYSHWKTDARIIRTLIDESGGTIHWLEEKGVRFIDVVHHLPNQSPEVYHITDDSENAGKAVIKALEEFCRRKGVTILADTRGKKLLKDETGAVCAICCADKGGEEVIVRAKKTILCTGGFAGNPEYIARYYPGFDSDAVFPGWGGMRHRGDGIAMALDAGAVIEGNFALEIAAPRIRGYEALNLIIGKPYNIWLNKFGVRFADESIVYNFAHAANACMRQPDSFIWILFDSGSIEKTLSDGRDIIEQVHIPSGAEARLYETIDKARLDGLLKKSDTISELSALIGCPLDTLERSLREYNGFCEHNRDALFSKKVRYLRSLDRPPYYAVKAGADFLNTHGGIRVNERFEALGSNFEPVENLYVAGVDFGGTDADVYNVVMSGHSFGFAVNSGRIAGRNAALHSF